ncbi:MAG: hypothetical protein F6K41_08035 [Symploca sp. SIO3E6]|nr:hypothetical protein [Caldora sp. SIO3E6]
MLIEQLLVEGGTGISPVQKPNTCHLTPIGDKLRQNRRCQGSGGAEERRSRGAEEQRSRGAEERRSGGAEEEEDNFP